LIVIEICAQRLDSSVFLGNKCVTLAPFLFQKFIFLSLAPLKEEGSSYAPTNLILTSYSCLPPPPTLPKTMVIYNYIMCPCLLTRNRPGTLVHFPGFLGIHNLFRGFQPRPTGFHHLLTLSCTFLGLPLHSLVFCGSPILSCSASPVLRFTSHF